MSIASRITSIENHIEEAYTEISRLGVDLTNVDKNIDNIADMLQEAYENTPKVTGEGSSLSLTPTRKGGLTIIPKGACEQDSYSGKNKANINNFSNTSVLTIENDTIKLQNNTNSSGYYYTSKKLSDIAPTLQVGDVVYLSFNTTSTATNKNIIYLTSTSTVWTKGTSKTITQEMLNDYIALYGGYNETSVISQFMISTNSDISYEPYVGGLPSPSPDFPQSVRVVTGDNVITITNEDSSKSQTYTLHLGTEYFAGIGTYKDEIIGKTDDWKIRRKVGKYTFTGNETFSLSASQTTTEILTCTTASISPAPKLYTNTSLGGYHNRGNVYVLPNIVSSTANFFKYNNNVLHFVGVLKSVIPNYSDSLTDAQKISVFKAYLQNNENTIVYLLQTEQEIPITDQTLITDLNNMYQAMGYDGTTNITISSDSSNAQMEAQVSALKGE